jgi:NAD(P) transhydrogenase subunit alpha
VNREDVVIRDALVVHLGEITWPPPRIEPATPPQKADPTPQRVGPVASRPSSPLLGALPGAVAAALAILLGVVAPPAFLSHFTVFVLACVIGWQVVWNVTPALHTPLMGVTNAISGIIVIGGMLQLVGPPTSAGVALGATAVLLAAINIVGGFLVTHRMLRMFRR